MGGWRFGSGLNVSGIHDKTFYTFIPVAKAAGAGPTSGTAVGSARFVLSRLLLARPSRRRTKARERESGKVVGCNGGGGRGVGRPEPIVCVCVCVCVCERACTKPLRNPSCHVRDGK